MKYFCHSHVRACQGVFSFQAPSSCFKEMFSLKAPLSSFLTDEHRARLQFTVLIQLLVWYKALVTTWYVQSYASALSELTKDKLLGGQTEPIIAKSLSQKLKELSKCPCSIHPQPLALALLTRRFQVVMHKNLTQTESCKPQHTWTCWSSTRFPLFKAYSTLCTVLDSILPWDAT